MTQEVLLVRKLVQNDLEALLALYARLHITGSFA